MSPVINETVDQRPAPAAAATAQRRRQGAHTAARRLAARVDALSQKDLLILVDALLDEMEQRGLSYELVGLEAL